MLTPKHALMGQHHSSATKLPKKTAGVEAAHHGNRGLACVVCGVLAFSIDADSFGEGVLFLCKYGPECKGLAHVMAVAPLVFTALCST